MATVDEIKALVASMPELDNPPQPAKPQAAAEAPKPKLEKGKLTGPAWADAVKVYDAILSGGAESVGVVLDMVSEKDVGPAYKPRYVAHALAVYATRAGKEKERAA